MMVRLPRLTTTTTPGVDVRRDVEVTENLVFRPNSPELRRRRQSAMREARVKPTSNLQR